MCCVYFYLGVWYVKRVCIYSYHKLRSLVQPSLSDQKINCNSLGWCQLFKVNAKTCVSLLFDILTVIKCADVTAI